MRVGMCDWSLGKGGAEAIRLAKQIGLDGVQISVDPGVGRPGLRDPDAQQAILDACKEHGVAIPSLALGTLNSVPLKSEPVAAIWVSDTIPLVRKLGATNVLLAFFGRGQLSMADEADINRVVAVLKELGPRAEAEGVLLGLENTLSAEDNLNILEQVGSPAVQVYYDPKNSAGRDVVREIHLLKGLICEVHLKNGNKLLSERDNVDFAAVAQAFKETGYPNWYVLETSSPSGDVIADTRKNIEHVRAVFGE